MKNLTYEKHYSHEKPYPYPLRTFEKTPPKTGQSITDWK